ncbi:hypothetical protein HMI56_004935 [Coelomomyces lativittatus]|nr:hypothetical protein HMI56_004935 [Coelomomyces lativittatus]
MPVDTTNPDCIFAHLTSSPTTSVTVHVMGATVISWKTKNVERLFLSEKAVLDSTKAIRIPLVFPIFGPDPKKELPQHGFARISKWKYLGAHENENDKVMNLQFALDRKDVAPEYLDVWSFQFTLIYTVILSETNLLTQLDVKNTGETSFSFNLLFHTYFKVKDIHQVTIPTLSSYPYLDTLTNKEVTSTSIEPVTLTEETDRIYFKVQDRPLTIHPIQVELTSNLPDRVLWNPWKKPISDLHRSDEMICLEPGQVQQPIHLPPNTSFRGFQKLCVSTYFQ